MRWFGMIFLFIYLFIFLSSSFYLVSSAQVLPYEMWYIIVVVIVNTAQPVTQEHIELNEPLNTNTKGNVVFLSRFGFPECERKMRQIFDGKKWRMEINKFLLIFHLPCRGYGPPHNFYLFELIGKFHFYSF